ncbi:MAG: universal stress protein [Deltaproteobacteria bacterium]|nr:MAG: universal stress protein [Deltaproteobacteria bacterium]
MYKKILVPVDGSEFSECSLDHVKNIAIGCKVPEIVLLMVIEPFHPTAGISEDWRKKLEQDAQTEAEDYLAKLSDRLELKNEGIKIKTEIVHGRPAGNILKYASENNIDLIIMSTHGMSGVSHWIFGSVTERVLHHSPVPVLIASPASCRVHKTHE